MKNEALSQEDTTNALLFNIEQNTSSQNLKLIHKYLHQNQEINLTVFNLCAESHNSSLSQSSDMNQKPSIPLSHHLPFMKFKVGNSTPFVK